MVTAGRVVEVDGLSAPAERPATAEELAGRLAEAAAAGLAVIPVGGERALGLGDVPDRFDLALSTAALDRVLEVSQADMTATVEAGVTLERLNEGLGAVGQFLPLDPFGGPGHSVGGALAAGLAGPLRLRYGSARDYLIGLRVALPDGRLVRSGGKVVKNVSGYDMNKLHLGAMGSLGVIVEASFKVYPLPLHEETVGLDANDLDSAWAEAERALALPLPPIALVLEAEAGSVRLLARLAGTRQAVDRMARELGWAPSPRSWAELATLSSGDWARVSVPPQRLRGVLGELPRDARLACLPGVGTAHWLDAGDEDAVAAARAAAERAGGWLVLLAADAALKRSLGAWGSPPPTIELMRRVRDAFDPGRTLSPGRYSV